MILRPSHRLIAAALSLSIATAHAASAATPRIIGGSDTSTTQWPWMTALIYRSIESSYDGQFCGGSLIHPRWILTAGHCFLDHQDNVDSSIEVDAVIGRTNLTADNGRRIAVSRIVVNPAYTPAIDDGDVALLELSEAVSGVTPLALPGQVYDAFFASEGTTSTVLGWGTTSASAGVYPDLLKKVSLPLVSNEECQTTYGTHPITDNMICAGDGRGGRDSCQGDSGGPLVIDDGSGGSIQVGVVSFGEGCAQPDTYGVYSRVSRYAQWISDTACSATERPAAPTVEVQAGAPGQGVDNRWGTLSISPVTGATGYRLFYAPAPGMSPIRQLDLGDETTGVFALQPGATDLFLAAQAYNGACLGEFSAIGRLTVGESTLVYSPL